MTKHIFLSTLAFLYCNKMSRASLNNSDQEDEVRAIHIDFCYVFIGIDFMDVELVHLVHVLLWELELYFIVGWVHVGDGDLLWGGDLLTVRDVELLGQLVRHILRVIAIFIKNL